MTNAISNCIDTLLEFGKSIHQRFMDQGANADEVASLLSDFETLKNKNLIQGDLRDIQQVKTIKQLRDIVSKASKKTTKTAKKKQAKIAGSEVFKDTKDYTIYKITSEEASCQLGAGTKWCTAATKGENYFDYYKGQGVTLYYIISKNRPSSDPLYKVAVAVYSDKVNFEVYNANDNLDSDALTILGISPKLFGIVLVDLNTEQGFLEWLTAEKVKWTKNSKGLIDVQGDVTFPHKGLTKIPVQFGIVSGDFNCYENQLTSLQGAPQSVGGHFNCYHNKLTNLQGAPQSVGGHFNCYHNKLTNLQGGPSKVGGHFFCNDNKLTNLQGAPQNIGDDFACCDNLLTSLQGAPQSIGHDFYCYHNKLTSLQGAPQNIGGDFFCAYNQLTSLQGAPQNIGGGFRCGDNPGNFTQDEVDKALGRTNAKVEEAIDALLDARPPANVYKPEEITYTCPYCGYNLGLDKSGAGVCPECKIHYLKPVPFVVKSLDAKGKRHIQGGGKVFRMPGSSKIMRIANNECIQRAIDNLLEDFDESGLQ